MEKQTKYAVFYYEKQDEDLIDELASALEEKAQDIFAFFEIIPTKKAQIRIIPTKQQYDDIYRKERNLNQDYPLPLWAIGNCREGVITYLSLHDYKSTSHKYKDADYELALDYYKKTIVHEYVHFVNENFNEIKQCAYTEKYLVEGIATYLSGQKTGQEIIFDYTIEQILARDMQKSCYDGWFLVTKYFVENYAKDFILEIFQSSRQARELLTNELYEKAKQHYINCEKESNSK